MKINFRLFARACLFFARSLTLSLFSLRPFFTLYLRLCRISLLFYATITSSCWYLKVYQHRSRSLAHFLSKKQASFFPHFSSTSFHIILLLSTTSGEHKGSEVRKTECVSREYWADIKLSSRAADAYCVDRYERDSTTHCNKKSRSSYHHTSSLEVANNLIISNCING